MNVYPIDLVSIKTRISRKNNRALFKKFKHKNSYFDFGDIFINVKNEINKFGEKVIRVDGDIPVKLEINNNDHFLFISYDQSALTHGFHKYPAKFFPELPRWLVKKFSKEYDLVLDPFSGSGTTNVEALLNKRHSVGIDVDPFSRFLAQVKTTPLDVSELKRTSDIILNKIMLFNHNLVSENDIPNFPYRDNWFNKYMIYELAYIRKIINNLETKENIKYFYKICFSSIIRAVSNADDNCTRTVIRKKLNKQVYPSDALIKFTETLLVNLPKMEEFTKLCPSDINTVFPKNCDARYILYPSNIFDLAVISPPYANAVDYPRTHQLEMYWLGLVDGSLVSLKEKHIVYECVKANEYKILHQTNICEIDNVIKKIFEKDNRRAYICYKYLIDMRDNLKEVYRVLKPGAYYIIVVGNNKIRGEIFQNWLYIMKLAESVGFIVEKYFASEIIKHFIKVPREERINTDWILLYRKIKT